jgi:hypothetical protein
MARPVKIRNADTYRRDIENLTRLRTAVRLDRNIEADVQHDIFKDIDSLMDALDRLMRACGPAVGGD